MRSILKPKPGSSMTTTDEFEERVFEATRVWFWPFVFVTLSMKPFQAIQFVPSFETSMVKTPLPAEMAEAMNWRQKFCKFSTFSPAEVVVVVTALRRDLTIEE